MRAESVDLNTLKTPPERQPQTVRQAAKALSEYHEMRNRELAEIVGEQAQESALAEVNEQVANAALARSPNQRCATS